MLHTRKVKQISSKNNFKKHTTRARFSINARTVFLFKELLMSKLTDYEYLFTDRKSPKTLVVNPRNDKYRCRLETAAMRARFCVNVRTVNSICFKYLNQGISLYALLEFGFKQEKLSCLDYKSIFCNISHTSNFVGRSFRNNLHMCLESIPANLCFH